jgi:hypothetical protein
MRGGEKKVEIDITNGSCFSYFLSKRMGLLVAKRNI